MKIRIKDGQSLVDVALITTGAAEGVWSLALRNGLSVTETLAYGTELAYEADDILDPRTADRYLSEEISPATEVSPATLKWLLEGSESVVPPDFGDIEADEVRPQSTRAAVFSAEFTAAFA